MDDGAARKLIKSAVDNGGWATPSLAVEAGVPRSTYQDLVARQGWARVQRGCHALPGAPLDWRQHGRMALHALGQPAALTGSAALRAHGLRTGLPRGEVVQVVVPAGRSATGLRPPVEVHRCDPLTRADIVTVRGLPCVRPAWAIIHLGRVESDEVVLDALAAALQAGLLTLDELEATLARAGRAHGVRAARRAAAIMARGGPDSPLERRVLRLLRRYGLRPADGPFPTRAADGRVIHLDIAFPEVWFALEVDGVASHSGDAVTTDRRRWRQAKKAGWSIGWVTADRLRNDPLDIVDEVRSALATANPRRAPAQPERCPRTGCHVCRIRFDR